MKICPFCNKKINLNFDSCPHCENNLKVYRLYKNAANVPIATKESILGLKEKSDLNPFI